MSWIGLQRDFTSPQPMMNSEEAQEFISALHSLNDRLDRFIETAHVTPTAQAVNNGGSVPAWLAALFAGIAATSSIFVAMDNTRQEQAILSQDAKAARTQDYLNQLWQKYPELRPERLEGSK